jgi:hypothetical protein
MRRRLSHSRAPGLGDRLPALLAVVALLLAVAATDGGAGSITGTAKADVLRGSKGNDVISGLAGADRLYGNGGADRLFGGAGDDALTGGTGGDTLMGNAGNDRLYGGPGDDRLLGGPGEDVLAGGAGKNRIDARDGVPDIIVCAAAGQDTILQDAVDTRTQSCPPVPPPPPRPDKTVIRNEESWSCLGEVDLDLVKVTIHTKVDDAIRIDKGCTGRIGRIEVDTWTADGVKVQNRGAVAHDLVIESGYVKCHDAYPGYHQDGVQAMGGYRLTFRNLAIDCLRNANFFMSRGGAQVSTPTDIVCERCILGPNSAQTVFWSASLRSGVRNSTICTGRYRALRVSPNAQDPIDASNTILPRGDPACADVTGHGPLE